MKTIFLFLCLAFTCLAHAQYDTIAGLLAVVKQSASKPTHYRSDTVRSVLDGSLETIVQTPVYNYQPNSNQSKMLPGYAVRARDSSDPLIYLDGKKKPLDKSLRVFYFIIKNWSRDSVAME